MDPLSDLLRVVRLEGAYFFAVEASEPWSVETMAAKELSPRIMPAAEHLISYHILTEGRCYAGVLGEEQVELLPGDVIVFPHGDAHVMSSGRGVRVGPDMYSTAPARSSFRSPESLLSTPEQEVGTISHWRNHSPSAH